MEDMEMQKIMVKAMLKNIPEGAQCTVLEAKENILKVIRIYDRCFHDIILALVAADLQTENMENTDNEQG